MYHLPGYIQNKMIVSTFSLIENLPLNLSEMQELIKPAKQQIHLNPPTPPLLEEIYFILSHNLFILFKYPI